MLVVDFIELREVVAAGDFVGELVVQATKAEMLAGDGAGKTAVLVVEGDVLVVGAVAILGFVQAPAGECQVLDFLGAQQAAFKGLRQDAAVVGLEDRQLRDQAADFQFRCGDFHFAGQAELGILIDRTPIVGRQQASAGTVRTRIELDPQHAQCIDPEPHGAVGVA
ncbi:hypothetical protein D3C81_1727810 [compost metagenome]